MNDELRAALDKLDAALAEARAALEAEPEPATEPEPPSVEVIDVSGRLWRFWHISTFIRLRGRHAWQVWGGVIGRDERLTEIVHTDATPFSIWEACIAAGVPCPEPPCDCRWEYDQDGGSWACQDCGTVHPGDEYPPAAIRAACAEKGVPCPDEEKPLTIAIDTIGGRYTWAFAAITSLSAVWRDEVGACLRVRGDCNRGTVVHTRTLLADIRKQAAEAGIELPEVTVRAGYEWSHIAEVQHRADGTTIFGQVAGEGIHNETNLTPAQVLALCALAGWPKPEVRCVFTFCDGEPCEVDPASVCSVDTIRLPGERSTLVTCEDGGTSCFVRESVAVVEAMLDACKEVGDDGNM